MGFIMMMFSLAYAIFEVPGGWLGDRIGPRKVITRIVIWWSAFTMATGLATGFWSLTIVRFLFGVGEAGAFPNLTKAFSNWFVGEDRTRAQAIMWLAARWGGALTPLLVVFVLDFVNWRQSFYIFGAVGFVWAFFFFRWFRDTPDQHPGVNAAELARLARPAERHGAGHAHGQRAMDEVLHQPIGVAALPAVRVSELRLLVLHHLAADLHPRSRSASRTPTAIWPARSPDCRCSSPASASTSLER